MKKRRKKTSSIKFLCYFYQRQVMKGHQNYVHGEKQESLRVKDPVGGQF
jgi:hypothetical protein